MGADIPRADRIRVLAAAVIALTMAPFHIFCDGTVFNNTMIAAPPASQLDISTLIPPIRGIPSAVLPQGIPDKGPVRPSALNEDLLRIIPIALSWLGTAYSAGGASKAGTDCSGFVHAVFTTAVPELGPFPRTSGEFAVVGTKIDSSQIQEGDILIFENAGAIDHVGIALSKFSFIHSASEGSETGVIISNLFDGHWRAKLCEVRRVAP